METVKEIAIKIEPSESNSEPEQAENSENNAKNDELQQQVWIKSELPDDLQDNALAEDGPKDTDHETATEETNKEPVKLEENDANNTDSKKQESILKLPVKKRKALLKKRAKETSDAEVANNEDEKKTVEDTENAEQPEQADDDKDKEKYIMYSYEVTKNIQIMIITEPERLEEHLENLKSKQHMRYVCEHCAIGFVLSDAYAMHMKVHSPEAGDHECDVCHCRLRSADMLYRHKLRHYRRYRCLLCWSRFKDKDKAACHVMTEHIGTSFQCDRCGRGFKRPQYLKRHVEQYHTKSRSFECPVCCRVFHERGWYRSHVRTHNEELRSIHENGSVTCEICFRELKTKASLKRHLRSHNPEILSCDLCEKKCKNKTVLGQHYLDVHKENYDGAPELTCNICLRVCATRAMLNRHRRRMHTDRTKKYQCDHCQRLYLTKGEVRSHITWSHMPVDAVARGAHACPCGRIFRTPSLLRRHVAREHSLEPPPRIHQCEHCDKAFANKQVLNRHKKVHTNDMYPCNECGRMFKTQSYVKVHHQIKHLNMTRAEIKAKRKRNKPITLPQDKIIGKPNWESFIPSLTDQSVGHDPLMVVESDVQIKIEREDDDDDDGGDDDMHVPLFQTFVDVNRS